VPRNYDPRIRVALANTTKASSPVRHRGIRQISQIVARGRLQEAPADKSLLPLEPNHYIVPSVSPSRKIEFALPTHAVLLVKAPNRLRNWYASAAS
jgi:hypothetical protein